MICYLNITPEFFSAAQGHHLLRTTLPGNPHHTTPFHLLSQHPRRRRPHSHLKLSLTQHAVQGTLGVWACQTQTHPIRDFLLLLECFSVLRRPLFRCVEVGLEAFSGLSRLLLLAVVALVEWQLAFAEQLVVGDGAAEVWWWCAVLY